MLKFTTPGFESELVVMLPAQDRPQTKGPTEHTCTNLEGVTGGETRSAEELLPLVYDELRKLAAARMANELGTQTLQPTALVHEAWLKLVGGAEPAWQNRKHFFAAAAEAMRHILIDHARSRGALKRGAGARRLDLDKVDVAVEADSDVLLAMNDALQKLAAHDPQCAELVKLRFFAGMDYEEAAKALGLSVRSANRLWSYARAWLYREMSRTQA